MIPEARGTVWLADRLPGGLAGLAGWRAGWHLVEKYNRIGKLVAEPFGHERREPKELAEHG